MKDNPEKKVSCWLLKTDERTLLTFRKKRKTKKIKLRLKILKFQENMTFAHWKHKNMQTKENKVTEKRETTSTVALMTTKFDEI